MKSFKILGLSTPNRNYKLDDRTGFYNVVANNGNIIDNQDPKGLQDILLHENCLLTIAKDSLGRTWKVGDRFTQIESITSFKVIKNKLFVITIAGKEYPIEAIKPYVEPVVVAPKPNIQLIGVNNFKELQTKIEAEVKPIKLGSAGHPFTLTKGMVMSGFIINLIRTYNNQYDTTYVSNGHVQTEAGKRRSLGDIYMLCKQYYPECNLHEVINLLYVKLPLEMLDLGSIRCEATQNRVWWIFNKPRFDHKEKTDIYGNNYQYYIDNLNKKPIIAAEETFESIKAKFPIGTKFQSMITAAKAYKVDSGVFYNGMKSIVVVQKDGSRKIIYDKQTKRLATIIK